MPINFKKVEGPATEITCVDININAKTGVLTIPQENIQKIRYLIQNWLCKTTATRHQLQKLVGNLLYIHRCVKPARLFTNRILKTLKNAPKYDNIVLSPEFFRDINWFSVFMDKFNGSVEIHMNNQLTREIYVDSSLQGMGAFFEGQVYAVTVLHILQRYSIVHLEAANVLMALRCWADTLKNASCIIWCDNFAVVNCFSGHKIKDDFCQLVSEQLGTFVQLIILI